MTKAISTCFLIVGIINFLPVIGILSSNQLENMYGISNVEQNLSILLKHRAILFGLLGGYIIYAVFNIKLQLSALVLGFASMISFIVIAFIEAPFNESIRNIIAIDVIGIVVFSVAAILYYKNTKT